MSMNANDLQVLDLDKKENALENASDIKLKLRKDPEVVRLVKSIDMRDQISLLEFGKEPANQISTFAGRVLNTVKSSSMEESSALLKSLGKIMDKFDSKDFAEDKGLFSKLFGKGKNFIEKIMTKYQTMGGEIDKVYIEIKKYETEMKNSTVTLEQLYDENFKYYLELEKYIVAAELKAEEIKTTLLPQLEQRAASDQIAAMELDSTRNALELVEQRAFDLEMAKQVAFQSAPQIRLLQRGNTKLIAKINSAFVTTIPIFKTGLINAIAAKRQKLVADSMSELDRRTNEMLLKNAQSVSNQSAEIARLAGTSSIKIETIEETWGIIMKGLEETRAIEEENKRNREDGKRRLEELQKAYEQQKEKMAK